MILCDTGFMVGLILSDDPFHQRGRAAMGTLRSQLISNSPCITEAMHIVGAGAGQEALRQFIESGFLQLIAPTRENALRACELMRQYADAPMDFADASLVVAAETLGMATILTYDGHFYAYRVNGKTAFEVLPA